MDWASLHSMFGRPILTLGKAQLSLIELVLLLAAVVGLFIMSSQMRRRVLNRLLLYSPLDASSRQLAGTVAQYTILFVGVLIILQTAGIDLTTLNVLAGALGVGIGFGLQNIASNFVSGLIILLERPIRIGDRVEIGTVNGEVVEVRARATTVLTNDGIAIIVPNSRIVTENVVNWSFHEPRVRFHVPVTVAYGTDARLVERVLCEVGQRHPDVLKDPAPAAWLMRFSDRGVDFDLLVWTATLVQRRGRMVSELNYAIYAAFAENGITIPVAQREIQLRQAGPDEPA